MKRKQAKLGGSRHPVPEYRIWVSYPGFLTVIVGLVVFCVQVDNISSYNVTPIVGIAIAAFGNQIITTVLVTYAVDCHHEHAASIRVFINLVRSTWGFIGRSFNSSRRGYSAYLRLGPFWFPDMFDSIGFKGSAGLMIGIIVVFAILPVLFIQFRGKAIREKRAENQMNTITR
jgi:hypothetical protein